MGLLETVRTALVTSGVASASWPCYIGYTPDDVNQVMTLYYSGGFAQDTQLGDNVLPTFQLTIRAGQLDHATCEAKAWAAFNALENQSLSGILLLHAMNSAPAQWNDAENRTNMSFNFRAVIARPS